jgi:2-iminobutanoate/2-iminopropanoate deaminase
MALQEEITSRKAYRMKGPVSLGIKAGDFIYLSAQLPFDPKTKKIVSDDFREQAERCLKNIEIILNDLGLSSEYILKTTVYLTDMKQYDILNEVYSCHFKAPYPARACLGVNELPCGAQISIEAYAMDTRALEVIIASEDSIMCKNGCCQVE